MELQNFYDTAHLFVAAIRVIQYRQKAPATMDQICEMLNIPAEKGHWISRKLKDACILTGVEGAFGERLHIENHLAIEEIPREEADSGMQEEVKRFQDERKHRSKEIESFAAKQEEKRKQLFASLEKQLKKPTR